MWPRWRPYKLSSFHDSLLRCRPFSPPAASRIGAVLGQVGPVPRRARPRSVGDCRAAGKSMAEVLRVWQKNGRGDTPAYHYGDPVPLKVRVTGIRRTNRCSGLRSLLAAWLGGCCRRCVVFRRRLLARALRRLGLGLGLRFGGRGHRGLVDKLHQRHRC